VAHFIGNHGSNLSKMERGAISFPVDVVRAIKTALDVEWLPIYEHERAPFKERMLAWYDDIADNNLEEAKKMQPEFAKIKYLPIEEDFNILYDLFSCRLHIKLGEKEVAEEIFQRLGNIENNATEESMLGQYYYYFTKTSLEMADGRDKEALESAKKAKVFLRDGTTDRKERKRLAYITALCYGNLGSIGYVISTLEDVQPLCSGKHENFIEYYIDIFLAKNYIVAGNLRRANILAKECYKTATSSGNKNDLTSVLLVMGFLHRKAKRWSFALDYVNEVIPLCDKESANYLEAIYQKLHCYMDTSDYSKCPALIQEGKMFSALNERETYKVMFKSVECLLSLNVEGSIDYLENIALPYLEKEKAYGLVIDYSEILIAYYEKGKGHMARMLVRTMALRNIYNKILEGSYGG